MPSLSSSSSQRFHYSVRQEGKHLSLYFGPYRQSRMLLEDPAEGGLNYTEYFHLAWLLTPRIERVLFIGLGGGTGPKLFLKHYPTVRVDVAEVAPEIVEVARARFALPQDERLTIWVADGREVVADAPPQTYDVIYLDAYTTTNKGRCLVPPQLCTVEFFQEARRVLTPEGCLFDNLIGTLDFVHQRPVRAVLRTLLEVFPSCWAFDVYGSFNTVLYALCRPQAWDRERLLCSLQQWRPPGDALYRRLKPLLNTYVEHPPLTNAPVLKDAANEIARLMEEVF